MTILYNGYDENKMNALVEIEPLHNGIRFECFAGRVSTY